MSRRPRARDPGGNGQPAPDRVPPGPPPDLVVHPLHGNVDTRLRRLDDGETDALVLACAGLDRLGLGARIAERLDPDSCRLRRVRARSPSRSGARRPDARARGRHRPRPDTDRGRSKRAFLETSGGGCRAPIGALATIRGATIEILAGHASPDGSMTVIERRSGPVRDARRMAVDFASDLLPATRLDGRQRPVRGRTLGRPRVLVTRASGQSGALATALRGAGLDPVEVPAISIEFDPHVADLDRAVRAIGRYRWVVITSANGARAIIAAAERASIELGGPDGRPSERRPARSSPRRDRGRTCAQPQLR